MKNIAIITARSGSKGLPHKNIKLLAGKPLMAWSIEAALESGMFDTVMVSTDSEEYAKIAREYGAEVPFLRSEATSQDNSNSWDVVAEVIDEYKKLGREFDTLMLLQPTSPLRNSDDIKKAYEHLAEKNGTAVVGVCECEFPPLLCGTFGPDWSFQGEGRMVIIKELQTKEELAGKYLRRQSMPTFYRPNGAMYLVTVKRFNENRNIYDKNCYALVMPQENSIDVDTELDFVMAEAVFKHFRNI